MGNKHSVPKLHWKHKDAAYYLSDVMKLFGPPEILVPQAGGMAIWTEKQLKNTCYARHELKDESVNHCVPGPHKDFFL